MKKKRIKPNKLLMFIGGTALTVSGFMIIPPLLKMYSTKLYKKSLKINEIDFDSMGPEIIPYYEIGENDEY